MAALLALVASLMWGASDFLGGTLSRRRAVLAVTLASELVGLVLLSGLATVTGDWRAEPDYWPWALAAGVLGMGGILAFYSALAAGTMGIVAPTAALSVLVPLALGLARGEQPSSWQILGIVLAVGGIVLASGPELSEAANTRPVLLALAAAVLFGLMFAAIAEGSTVNAVMTMVGMRLVAVPVALVALLVARSAGGLRVRDLPALAALGFLDSGANLAWGLATTVGLLSVTAVLGSLYPVVTAVLAAVVHHERLRAVQYAGVAAALAGIVLISAG